MQVLLMAASMLLLIAASFMMSCATRINPTPRLGFAPHTMTGLAGPGHMINTQVNPLQVRMQSVAEKNAADSYTPMLADLEGVVVPTNIARGTHPDARVLHQRFPPTTLFMDSRLMLDKMGEEQDEITNKASIQTVFKELEKGIMLDNIRTVVAEATSKYKSIVNKDSSDFIDRERLSNLMVEMVGLIPSAPSADHASVLAIGAFSRSTIKDDGKGSIADLFWRDGSKLTQIDVFAITGLMDAPGSPEGSAKALMLQIEKYAMEEGRIVVVPEGEYKSGSGEDLTEYYVSLGFEKVEMEGGRTELVYTGPSSAADALEAENQQIMVGLDLWSHI